MIQLKWQSKKKKKKKNRGDWSFHLANEKKKYSRVNGPLLVLVCLGLFYVMVSADASPSERLKLEAFISMRK